MPKTSNNSGKTEQRRRSEQTNENENQNDDRINCLMVIVNTTSEKKTENSEPNGENTENDKENVKKKF